LAVVFQDDLEAARAAAASTYAVCVEAGNRTVRCGVAATLARKNDRPPG